MTHIFVLNSYPTAGKDSFVDMISARHEGIFKMSSVDLVKQVARVAGWDGTKTSKNRKFLSDLKDLLTEWNDVPYCDIENRIKEIEFYNKDDKPILIFVMVREPKEIQKMVDRLGVKTIFINRPCLNNVQQSNHADNDVKNYTYDYYIDNDGDIDMLIDKAENFYQMIVKGE